MFTDEDELFEFADEEEGVIEDRHGLLAHAAWSVLVVDDEDEVHQATRFALSDVRLLGLPVQLDSAHSAAQARILLQERSYACVLLDVVMESEDAGLKLVQYIRNELRDHVIRIILRTGQPGYAPEIQVIEQYDINDYKNKSELTVNRLSASLIASLRTYEQIKTIDANRRGLELILKASSNLLQKKAVQQFAKGALIQVCSLLKIKDEGFVWARRQEQDVNQSLILSASGRYQALADQPLSVLDDQSVQADMHYVLTNRVSLFKTGTSVLYIQSPHGAELVVHVRTDNPLTLLDKRLLELFCINVAVGFDNAAMFEQTERLAYVDGLTGITNRTAFEKNLAEALIQHANLAVVLLDIDNFQAINDGLGHSIGDKVLQHCPTLLAQVFPASSCAARFGSDIFAIIHPLEDRAQFKQQMALLNDLLKQPLCIDHFEIPLSFSVGMALYPEHEDQPLRLLQKANIALKHAKNSCRGSFEVFNPSFELSLINRLQIISDLHHCIDRHELRLHYQPKLELASMRAKGVEALVRWQQGDSLVAPGVFIPAAESSGHIIGIGEWVLREACRQHCVWRDQHQLKLQMAVNVSVRQLHDPYFLERLKKAIADTGIDPGYLELEVTESIMGDEQSVIDVLTQARALGLKISIDDFGTGYSSLSTLKNLPVDCLKIDQSFTRFMDRQQEYIAIVDLIINVAGHLKLNVIAEGVETAHQEQLLVQMGCDEVQGYRYAKPMSADDIVECIVKNNW